MILGKLSTPNARVIYIPFDFSIPFCVCEYGWEKTSARHKWSPNGRPRYLIHLIINGHGTVTRADGVSTHVGKGDCFISRPDEPSVFCSDEKEPCEYYWIAFTGQYSKNMIETTTKSLYPKYKESGVLAIKELLKSENSDTISTLYALFCVLNSIKDNVKYEEYDFVKKAVLHIENNYFEPFNVCKYSKSIGISRSYFTTAFTKETGMSPYDFLINVRIENSMKYLKETTLNISQIAYKVGFSSLDRFGRMFKQKTGLSPKQYRSSDLSISQKNK